ncbi:hypothetical protein BDV06DRAFT_93733 [Aspergillus oleicola]
MKQPICRLIIVLPEASTCTSLAQLRAGQMPTGSSTPPILVIWTERTRPCISAIPNQSLEALRYWQSTHDLGKVDFPSLNGPNGTSRNKLCPVQAPSQVPRHCSIPAGYTISLLHLFSFQEPGGWSHGYAGPPSGPLARCWKPKTDIVPQLLPAGASR